MDEQTLLDLGFSRPEGNDWFGMKQEDYSDEEQEEVFGL